MVGQGLFSAAVVFLVPSVTRHWSRKKAVIDFESEGRGREGGEGGVDYVAHKRHHTCFLTSLLQCTFCSYFCIAFVFRLVAHLPSAHDFDQTCGSELKIEFA